MMANKDCITRLLGSSNNNKIRTCVSNKVNTVKKK